jgi:lysosomal Pro-X carboxypeptidase
VRQQPSPPQRLDSTRATPQALGGSYGGMLAAWLRQHYPTAVVGAIAASAPVLAFDGIRSINGSSTTVWDDNSYWRVVTADATAATGGCVDGCVGGVRASWPALFELGRTTEGRRSLSSIFRLCEPLGDSDSDVSRLASFVLNVWDTLAMGNFPYPSNYLVYQQTQDPRVKLPGWPVRAACAPFDGASPSTPPKELLARMSEAVGVLYNASAREPCFTLPADPNYDGIWDFQYCTERLPQETYFGLDGTRDMFWRRPANASAVVEHCQRKYGLGGRTEWIAATSAFDSSSAASNILFSNGEFDPWRSGGVLRDLSPSVRALEVDKGAHHLDLFFSNPADPPSVRQVRQAEIEAIRGWVNESVASTEALLLSR